MKYKTGDGHRPVDTVASVNILNVQSRELMATHDAAFL
jgi:hypothetical protein